MKGLKDDEEMFKLFALFDKAKRSPERLSTVEKRKLRTYGVEV